MLGDGRSFAVKALTVLSAATFAGSVFAADIGGDCCADLEERVAELEATTVRKGNRKVSLEISGQVNEALLFWDDGDESNVYVVTDDDARTRFRFKGSAKIDKDWEAGYLIEIGVRAVNSKRFDQFSDDTPTAGGPFDLRDSAWFLKSKTYGAVWVGRTAMATNAITELNLSQTASFSKYADVEDHGLGLRLRQDGSEGNSGLSDLRWHRLIGDSGDQPGEGRRSIDAVRYESPALMGFTFSASWGEDDIWDAALRYAGDWNGFKIAAGIGIGENLDGPDQSVQCAADTPLLSGGDARCRQVGGSFSVLHESTGLFVSAGAGYKEDERIDETVEFAGTGVDEGQRFYAVQAGVEKKFIELGKTTIYGEYYNYEGGGNQQRNVDGADAINPFGADARIFSTEVEMYGAGIAQGIDAAAMILYLSYRHYESDVELLSGVAGDGTAQDADLEDLHVVMSGAIIRF